MLDTISESDISEFITDRPVKVEEIIEETLAYHAIANLKDKPLYSTDDTVLTTEEIQILKKFVIKLKTVGFPRDKK